MDAIRIRAAVPADADAVAAYHDRCFRMTFAAQLAADEFSAPDQEGTRQQLFGWFQPGSEFETRVAVIDGVPIAHFTVREHQLVHLFVSPDLQGVGLGTRLLAEGEALMAASGYSEFELRARVENTAAIEFYVKAGWTVANRLIHTAEHGISYDERILIKV